MAKAPAAKIPVSLDTRGLARDARGVKKSLTGALTPVVDVGRLASAALRKVSQAITGVVSASVEYEKALQEVTTIVDRSVTSTDKLDRLTKQLHAQYGGSMAGQAKALYQTISAGVTSARGSTELLHAANQLAIGGLTDVNTAVAALASVTNTYGQEITSARDVSDAFFIAIKAGQTDAAQLAAAIGGVAPNAKAVGVEFDELLAGMATITTKGIKTAEAATSLSGVFAALMKNTGGAQKEAKRLGIEFSGAALRAKGLRGFLQQITGAAKFNESSLIRLFGRVEAVKGVLALTSEGGKKFAETLGAMETRAGATGDAFGQMSQTFAFRADKLRAAYEQAITAAGDFVTKNDDVRGLLEDIERAIVGVARELRDNGPEIRATVSGFVSEVRALGAFVRDNASSFETLIKLFIAAKAIGGAGRLVGGVRKAIKVGAGTTASAAAAGALKGAAGTAIKVGGAALGAGALAVGAGGAMVGGLAHMGAGGRRRGWAIQAAMMRRQGLPPDIIRSELAKLGASEVDVDALIGTGITPSAQGAASMVRFVPEGDSFVSDAAGAVIRGSGKAAAPDEESADEKKARAKRHAARLRALKNQEREWAQTKKEIRQFSADADRAAYAAEVAEMDRQRRDQTIRANAANQDLRAQAKEKKQIWATMAQEASNLLAGTMGALTAALAAGEDDWGAMVGSMVGQVVSQVGMMLVQLGTAGILAGALGTAIPALTLLTGGPLGVAAGAAAVAGGMIMIAAGSALGAAVAPSAPRASASTAGGGGGGARAPGFNPGAMFGGGGGAEGTRPIVIEAHFQNVLPGSERRIARSLAEIMRVGSLRVVPAGAGGK